MKTQERKSNHLKTCLEKSVENHSTGFDDVTLIHNSLTELSIKDIDTKADFFGKKLRLPLIIASMTGGTEESKQINKQLAEVAEKKGIGFSLGSQRAMIEDSSLKQTYYVRDVAPNTLLMGNIGISQIKNFKVKEISNALESVGANALCVHINPAQELFQNGGDFDFRDLLRPLKCLCNELEYPVVGKEVGFGISREVAVKLKGVGISAIDVGGFGGTNWITVDGMISGMDYSNFNEWGIPTPISILESKVGIPLIATGGIRTGFDIAKSIALGADVCGIALPFLRALKERGKKGVEEYVDKIEKELKFSMFLTGSKNLEEMKKAKYVLTGKIKDWAEQRKLI